MYFILDVSRAKLPKWWSDFSLTQIPCVIGRHSTDLDVDRNRIEDTLYDEIWKSVGDPNVGPSEGIPIGFNLNQLPAGSTITAMEE